MAISSSHLANIQKRVHPEAASLAFRDNRGKLVAALALGMSAPFILPRLTDRVSVAPVALLSTGALLTYAGYCIRAASQQLRSRSVRQVAVELYNQNRSVDSVPEGVREEVRAAYSRLGQEVATFLDSDLKRLGVARIRLGFEEERFRTDCSWTTMGLTIEAICRSASEELIVSGSYVNDIFAREGWTGQLSGDERVSASVVAVACELLRRRESNPIEIFWLGAPLTTSQPVPGISPELNGGALVLLGRGKPSSTEWIEKKSALSVINGERELTSFPDHLRAAIARRIDLLWNDVDAQMRSPVHAYSYPPLLGELAFKWRLANESFSNNLGIKAEAIKAHYSTIPVQFTFAEVDFLFNNLRGSSELFNIDPTKRYDGQAIAAFSRDGTLPEGIQRVKALPPTSPLYQWAQESLGLLHSMGWQYDWTFPQEYALYDLGEGKVQIVFGPHRSLTNRAARYLSDVLLEAIPEQESYTRSIETDSEPAFSDGQNLLYRERRTLQAFNGCQWTVRLYTDGKPDPVRVQPRFDSGVGRSFFSGPSSS